MYSYPNPKSIHVSLHISTQISYSVLPITRRNYSNVRQHQMTCKLCILNISSNIESDITCLKWQKVILFAKLDVQGVSENWTFKIQRCPKSGQDFAQPKRTKTKPMAKQDHFRIKKVQASQSGYQKIEHKVSGNQIGPKCPKTVQVWISNTHCNCKALFTRAQIST